jgi:multidrug resistance efflux pump
VQAGDVLGKIYDSEAQILKRAAEFGLTAAVKRWENDVQIRYAKASADVARAKYEKMKQANKIAVDAVSEIEVLQAKLEWDAAVLSIEKSEHEQDLAKYDAYSKRAERDAAQLALERRTIRALFNGEVVDIKRRQGEWVNPGDPILRLVSLDMMWVDGWVDQAMYDPHELQGCSVTVEVEMARGRKEQVNGRISYVSSLLEDGRRFRVRAEVANREEFGRWLLRDGMIVQMTIHLDTGGAGAVDVSRAP